MAAHLLLVILAVVAACAGAASAYQPGSAEGHTIAGRIKIDAASAKGFGLPAKTSNTKVILNGGQRVTFARPDGYFAFHNVPAGTHLIEVSSLGYLFSPVRVDISARNPGHIQAALTENRRVLNELVLEPLREEQYYETREPFSIMSLLKSPMGMMLGFMVIMVFVMPKMMENIDPEEIKQAQEQMRNSPVPSFSGLLARANS
uniref:ER membrane protein complex subunit 7 beta-sandwich domain-containing protein n=1 Tax=Leersia perrieri TaxID=77586 RepID=A0A0D9WSJ3_9ORYZ